MRKWSNGTSNKKSVAAKALTDNTQHFNNNTDDSTGNTNNGCMYAYVDIAASIKDCKCDYLC